MNRFLACSAAAAASLLLISSAAAHVDLLVPESRYGNGDDTAQKDAPCGDPNNAPMDGIRTTFAPGETITVEIGETIYHGGYFRLAFDEDGDDDFVYPTTGNDNDLPGVLLDRILESPSPERPLQTTGTYQVEVTLPNVECENCTLQLLQVMMGNEPNYDAPLQESAFYYRCANLRLSADGSDAGPDTGTPDAGVDPDPADAGDDNTENPADPDAGVSGGCAVGGGAGAGAGLFLLGLALAALRRRS